MCRFASNREWNFHFHCSQLQTISRIIEVVWDNIFRNKWITCSKVKRLKSKYEKLETSRSHASRIDSHRIRPMTTHLRSLDHSLALIPWSFSRRSQTCAAGRTFPVMGQTASLGPSDHSSSSLIAYIPCAIVREGKGGISSSTTHDESEKTQYTLLCCFWKKYFFFSSFHWCLHALLLLEFDARKKLVFFPRDLWPRFRYFITERFKPNLRFLKPN